MNETSKKNAIKLLTDNMENIILPLTQKTLQQFKCPPRCNVDPEVLLPDKTEEVHPIRFASVDAERVRKAAPKTGRGAGSSESDTESWKRLLTSTQFGDITTGLCNTFAEVLKTLCTVENLSSSLEGFLACSLIPLNKNPR